MIVKQKSGGETTKSHADRQRDSEIKKGKVKEKSKRDTGLDLPCSLSSINSLLEN